MYQATALPVLPGIVSRPTPTPPVGNLHELFPETFGGVSYLPFVCVTYVPSIFVNKDHVHVKVLLVSVWFEQCVSMYHAGGGEYITSPFHQASKGICFTTRWITGKSSTQVSCTSSLKFDGDYGC